MAPLDYDVPSLFTFEAVPESPLVEVEQGIRINARGVEYDGERLSFELLVTYCFPRSYFACFQRLPRALVVMLEDAEGGRVSAARIIDPHKRYPRMQGPNFRGFATLDPAPKSFKTSWACLPLEVALARPATAPSFFATVFLQHHVSNTLAFDVLGRTTNGFLDGRPFPLSLGGDEEELDDAEAENEDLPSPPPVPPPPASPRAGTLTLSARKQGRYAAGEPIWLDASLAIPPEELAAVGPEGWVRSLFVCATRQDTQVPRTGHWLEDRLVFPDDVQRRVVDGQERAVFSAPFELLELLKLKLSRGVHYVQVSARQYRSNVLEIACE